MLTLQLTSRSLSTSTVLVVASVLMSPCALAGQRAEGREFDVASVRPREVDIRTPGTLEVGRDTLLAVNYPFLGLVGQAYGVRAAQIEKLPSWARTARFDIRAKASGPSSRAEMLVMLRALLEDRFKLRLRRESRMTEVYALATAPSPRQRSGLYPITVDCDTNVLSSGSKPGLYPADARPRCGATTSGRFSRAARLQLAAVTMGQFAASLQGVLERPVIDKTGLTGVFDIDLRFALNSEARGNNEPAWAAEIVPGLSVQEALRVQLGLVVTQARDSVEYYVVDSLEMPSSD